MKNTLKNFPTEKLILHKPSGDTYKVEGMVESSEIQSDDVIHDHVLRQCMRN